ncbi:MAG: triple tyrosine motif-containing protein [Cytophagales bacterium]|nr:triple tyrosine motif-containing protein [Cytophagales bacterium]
MRYISLVVFIFYVISAFGREPYYKFNNITVENGLPSNTFGKIVQDKTGLMWLLDVDGQLSTYDGYFVKRIETKYVKTGKHVFGKVNYVYPDGDIIWIGTDSALNKYNATANTFEYYYDPTDTMFSKTLINRYMRVVRDNKGRLWVFGGEDAKAILDEKNKKFIHYRHNPNDPYSVPKTGVMDIVSDSTGMWIAFWAAGITHYDARTDKFINYPINTGRPNGTQPIFSITKDMNGIIRASLYDGEENKYPSIVSFDTKSKKYEYITYDRNRKYWFNNINSNAIATDKHGHIWVGSSDKGIMKYVTNENKFYPFLHNLEDEESISESRNGIDAIYVDKDNRLWVGTLNKGLNYTNLNQREVYYYKITPPENIDHFHTKCLVEDTQKNIWIGTDVGLYKYTYSKGEIEYVPCGVSFLKTNKYDFAERMCQYNDHEMLVYKNEMYYLININTLAVKKISPPFIADKYFYNALRDSKNGLWVFAGRYINYYKNGNIMDMPTISKDINNISNRNDIFSYHFYEDREVYYIGYSGTTYEVNKEKLTFKKIFIGSDSNSTLGAWTGNITIFDKSGDDFTIFSQDKYATYNIKTGQKKIQTLELRNKGIVIPLVLPMSKGKVCLSSYSGVYVYDYLRNKYTNLDIYNPKKMNPDYFIRGRDGTYYLAVGNGFISFRPELLEVDTTKKPNIVITDLYLFNKRVDVDMADSPLKGNISYANELVFNYKQSVIGLELCLLTYEDKDKLTYAYKLEGFDPQYNFIGSRKVASYTNLPPGEYVFKYKGQDKNGIWSDEKSLKFIVLPPFWATWWFRTLMGLMLAGGLFTFYKVRINIIHRQKEKLEDEVKLRTAEIMNQNEEILAQKDEIEIQQLKISELYHEVTDSIQTAKRIQESILPAEDLIKQFLPESFVLYIPKDIVSGDFYWFHIDVDRIYVAAIDCTGHGVGGAFMSLIGYNLLNRIVSESKNLTPKDILDKLNYYVIQVLHQDSENAISKDGMEVAMCCIHKKQKIVQFAGANLPLYILRNNQLEIIKAEGNWVGVQPKGKISHFQNHEIEVQDGDEFYIFSDGFAGQFGGESGDEKFKYNRFREALVGLHDLASYEEQKLHLYKKFIEWKKDIEQTDDIMVIGFSVV